MNNLSVVDFNNTSNFNIFCNALIIGIILKNDILDKQREKSVHQEIQLREGILLLMLMI